MKISRIREGIASILSQLSYRRQLAFYKPDIDYKLWICSTPNVQALLNGTNTFLQPLRKRGIKVYLGCLGIMPRQVWEPPQRSESARWLGQSANCLDDEYTRGTASSERLTTSSPQAALCLCRELKLALAKAYPGRRMSRGISVRDAPRVAGGRRGMFQRSSWTCWSRITGLRYSLRRA